MASFEYIAKSASGESSSGRMEAETQEVVAERLMARGNIPVSIIEFNNKFNHMEVLESLDKEFNLIKELKNNVENTDKKSIETITLSDLVLRFLIADNPTF